MFSQFLANFTFLDVIIVVMIFWTSWSGFRKGAGVEVFKIFALVVAAFLGLHFYLRLGKFLDSRLLILHPVSEVLSYGLLVGVCVGIFRMIRDGIFIFFQQDDLKMISKCAGAVFGCFRAFLLGSLLLVGCLLVNHVKITRVVRHSFASRYLLMLSPAVYSGIFRSAVKPVFPGEQENSQVITLANQNRIWPAE